jgi:choline-sulfatase
MPAAADRKGPPPNILLVITDQQRHPRHWPQDPGWLAELMPNEAELARTGLTFTNAFCNTAMCSPSRATLLTGRYPAEHGVELTLTAADLYPDPRNAAASAATTAHILRRSEAPARRVLSQFARGALRIGPRSGNEPVLPPAIANLATLLREAGYAVAYKGKWHLTHPSGEGDLLSGWTEADAARINRDYGFADWEAPDAGENASAEHFGGGNAGLGAGWDEVYTAQAEAWLGRSELPEPFCLVVSLVNPHDVLGYPASYLRGGYSAEEFADLGVGLPPTAHEDLGTKPAVHALARIGMTAYLATRTIPDRCGRGPWSCAAPTTARWASPMGGCGRRCSTPTRRRSTCRWSYRARRSSAASARPMRSRRWWTCCPRSCG